MNSLKSVNEAAQEALALKAKEDEERRIKEEEEARIRAEEQAAAAAKAHAKASVKAQKQIAAIRAMGRKRPGSQTTPREQKAVSCIQSPPEGSHSTSRST